MNGLITQSNYIPWKGYFDSIALADLFIVFDDMQYTKRDWRNRNLIKTENGLKWLTIPVEVKGKYHQKIRDTKVANQKWKKSHWGSIKQTYKDSLHFKDISTWLEPLFLKCEYEYLTEINLHFINAINQYLGINTKIRYSSEFELVEDRNERLIDLCEKTNIDHYLTGPAARNYMDSSLFERNGITVHFLDYDYKEEYEQPYPPFQHNVSILDLLFCTGNKAPNYLKHT